MVDCSHGFAVFRSKMHLIITWLAVILWPKTSCLVHRKITILEDTVFKILCPICEVIIRTTNYSDHFDTKKPITTMHYVFPYLTPRSNIHHAQSKKADTYTQNTQWQKKPIHSESASNKSLLYYYSKCQNGIYNGPLNLTTNKIIFLIVSKHTKFPPFTPVVSSVEIFE